MHQKLIFHCVERLGTRFKSIRPLQGGDINDVYLLQTERGAFVVKCNSHTRFPEMFLREAEGLYALAQCQSIRCPKIEAVEVLDEEAVLILEYIPTGQAGKGFWENFARQLADLHHNSSNYFGWSNDNYIGSLPQYNSLLSSWPAFFITQRMYPQIELATERGFLDAETKNAFQSLFEKLSDILPEEAPALIHGDLWNGNFLIDTQGQPVLIDPAVSYASREMDLAMTRLFGGFPPNFYAAYQEAFPCADGLEERLKIYQLYYLMVHVNLFGASYLSSVKRILTIF